MLLDNPVKTSELVFPILEIFHCGFAVAIGVTAAVDFRILGFGLMGIKPAEIARATGFWMLGGLTVAIASGFALYSSDPDMYYMNWSSPPQNGGFDPCDRVELHHSSQSGATGQHLGRRESCRPHLAGAVGFRDFRRHFYRIHPGRTVSHDEIRDLG